MTTTHEVTNQVPPLPGHDVAAVPVLLEGVAREGAGWALASLHQVGELAGRPETQELGRLAEAHPPVLRTHDRYGHRIDRVDHDPAYHSLRATAVDLGLHGAPWRDGRPGVHVARAATFLLWSQGCARNGSWRRPSRPSAPPPGTLTGQGRRSTVSPLHAP